MEKTYWIIVNGVQTGPMSLEQLRRRFDLTPQTPVWCDGMPDWSVASQLPELADMFGAAPAQGYRAAAFDNAAPAGPSVYEPQPPTYLGWAIAATICCCLITGIVAIVYASKVAPAYQSGDIEAARRASEKAGWWCVISFVAGLIWTPFYMLYSMLAAF